MSFAFSSSNNAFFSCLAVSFSMQYWVIEVPIEVAPPTTKVNSPIKDKGVKRRTVPTILALFPLVFTILQFRKSFFKDFFILVKVAIDIRIFST
ncbi:unnamed protein product [Blepharisma stoltei]|uniref:Transmembrane protein n=1 Tax=Blepharisma stoltei TaxID=1481888 RepID=A0AAU9JG47_9CILI|nr:unnamed protein product [Blepharisma stoltei]